MALKSRQIGDNLLFWAGHRNRIIEAIGPDVVKFEDDFTRGLIHAADAPTGWTVTLVEGGAGETTIAKADGTGGHLLITTDAADNDGANLQLTGESYKLASGNRMAYFGTRFKSGEATQNDFILGLCITDTDLLGGLTDGIYFRKVDGSTSVAAVTEKNSTETQTAGVLTFAADTWYFLEFYWDGATVYFYVDGAQVAAHTTNIVDDEEITPSIHVLSGNAASETFTLDFVRAIQIGRN